MTPLRQHELVYLLSSPDPALNKRGLQRICDAIEAGYKVDLRRDPQVLTLIGFLKSSEDPAVRLWLSKLIGLLRDPAWWPWLAARLGKETRPENVTWSYGALSAISGTFSAREALEAAGHDSARPVFELASDYFRTTRPVDPTLLKVAMDADEPLTHQWLGMRHGRTPAAVPLAVMRELTTSDDELVVEYSLWAAHRDPHANLTHVRIDPTDFEMLPPNVRRWYTRLLVRDPGNHLPYLDIVKSAMNDANPLVREGVALGFANTPMPRLLADDVAAWIDREPDDVVRLALERVVLRHRRWKPFRQHAALVDRAWVARSESSTRSPAKILQTPRTRLTRKGPTLDAIPIIDSDSTEHVYALGVDTVGFSKRTDAEQYTIFRDLLDALHHDENVSSQFATDLCVLPTGDGFFVCLRQPANRLTPLLLALSLARTFESLRTYQLRFGVHAGPAMWITMRGGSVQVISSALNWTARVMGAAGEGQVMISDSFYRDIAYPARDRLAGVTFAREDGHATKHGEPLGVWSVRAAQVQQDD